MWLSDSTAGVATDPNGHVIQVPFRQPAAAPSSNFDYVSGNIGKSPEIGHAWPELLPGGSAVLYVISDPSDPGNWRIAARVLPDGEERILIDGGSNPRYVSSGHLVFVREGGLWAVEFDPERLTIHGTPNARAARGPDRAGRVRPLCHLRQWHADLRRGRGLAAFAPARLGVARRSGRASAAGRRDVRVRRSRAGRQARRGRPGRRHHHDIWVGDLARGTLSPVTRHGGEDGAPVWSPDGRRLALATEQWNGPPKLAISELAGGLRLAVDTGFRFSAPTDWSEDGRRV